MTPRSLIIRAAAVVALLVGTLLLWINPSFEAGQSARAQAPSPVPPVSPPPAAPGPQVATPIPTVRELGEAFSTVAEGVSPSVVSLQIEAQMERSRMPFFFGGPPGMGPDQGIQRGGGSGVIIRDDGYVLTNNHVIEHASRIEVVLRDGRRLTGTVVGSDPALDLAVIRVAARGLPAARFADVASVRPGEWVVAIGAPFGLDYTVTAGVVSAVGRAGLGANEIEDYIQTDASINPGNSGGPLVDLSGRVVGINTMIIGRGTGIGFALPGDLAQRAAEQIITSGRVRRAWIGVGFQELTPELATHLQMPADRGHRGALVSSVETGSPAARQGLRSGDIIVSVNDQPVAQGRDLLRTVLRSNVGESLRLGVVRDGQLRQTVVSTAERPGAERAQAPNRRSSAPVGPGFQLDTLTPQIARQLRVDTSQGVVVAEVTPGAPADHAGLQRADVIVEADRQPVRGPDDVRRGLADGQVLLRVLRGDGGAFFTVLNMTNP